MMDRPTILAHRFDSSVVRRPRRGLVPAVRPLEDRRLLTAPATAAMTQTVTFPDLESYPALSDQALLYFSGTMGTLTEVDLVTSGSFQTRFLAENLGSAGGTVSGTTAGNLTINVPSGAVSVAIPSVTETFNASAFDGQLDDGGTSGKTFASVTSRSTPQAIVLTSPVDLAAFTGHFRMPISVSGHAVGSVAPGTNDVSSTFQTDTSATITVIYHYIPNLPDLDPPPASPPPPTGGGTNVSSVAATGTAPGPISAVPPSVVPAISSIRAARHGHSKTRIHPLHRHSPRPLARHRLAAFDRVHHHALTRT